MTYTHTRLTEQKYSAERGYDCMKHWWEVTS